MYQWKHLAKPLPTQVHHPQRKVPSALQAIHSKRSPLQGNTGARYVVMSWDSVHELKTHHQTNHNILYCSTCNRAFNNPLSLSRHEYEHKHKDLKCPKCDHTFTFEIQVQAHMFSHWNNPSFFCIHPNCGKAFFNESDLTRHSKRHNSKWYQCLDCLYKDTDKRNFDSHQLSHSRIAKYKCKTCSKEFVFNTQKRRHIKDSKCPIKHSGSPTF